MAGTNSLKRFLKKTPGITFKFVKVSNYRALFPAKHEGIY